MNAGQIASVPALGTNLDFDRLFVGDTTGRMVEADPISGAISGAQVLWNGAASTPVAITADPDVPQRVWALHADGFVVNWLPGPAVGPWFWPPAFSGSSRVYCDMDRANDGVTYVSTVDDGVAMLWRRTSTATPWEPGVALGTEDCPRVAHDLWFDRLYVLRGNGFTLEERDVGSMATVLSSHVLDVDGGTLADVDIFAGVLVGAGDTAPPSGPPPGGGPPVPSFRMAWHYDPANGQLIDAKVIGAGPPAAVNLTANNVTSQAEMLVGTSAGTNSVRAVALLDD